MECGPAAGSVECKQVNGLGLAGWAGCSGEWSGRWVCVCVCACVCVYGQCLSLLVCVRQMFHKRTNNNNNNVLAGQAGNQAAGGVGNNARSTDCLTRYLSRVQKQQPSSTEEKGRVG